MTNIALAATTPPTVIVPASLDRDRTYIIQPDAAIYICVDGDQQTVLTANNGLLIPGGSLFTSATINDARLARQRVTAIPASGTVNVRVQWL